MPLEEDVDEAIVVYERILHAFAIPTREMIERYGILEALSRLVTSANLQQGFKILLDNNQRYYTFEAIVLRHQDRFRRDVVEAARWRLENPDKLL